MPQSPRATRGATVLPLTLGNAPRKKERPPGLPRAALANGWRGLGRLNVLKVNFREIDMRSTAVGVKLP